MKSFIRLNDFKKSELLEIFRIADSVYIPYIEIHITRSLDKSKVMRVLQRHTQPERKRWMGCQAPVEPVWHRPRRASALRDLEPWVQEAS